MMDALKAGFAAGTPLPPWRPMAGESRFAGERHGAAVSRRMTGDGKQSGRKGCGRSHSTKGASSGKSEAR